MADPVELQSNLTVERRTDCKEYLMKLNDQHEAVTYVMPLVKKKAKKGQSDSNCRYYKKKCKKTCRKCGSSFRVLTIRKGGGAIEDSNQQ